MGGGARNYWTQIAIQDREVRVIRMSDLRLALGIIAVLVVATLQEARPEDEGSSVNIAAIQERIHKHIKAADLDALEKLGLEIEKQWRATNPVLYARATLMLCRALSSKRHDLQGSMSVMAGSASMSPLALISSTRLACCARSFITKVRIC